MADPLDEYLKNTKKQDSKAQAEQQSANKTDTSSPLLNRLDRDISDEEIERIASRKKELIRNIIIFDALLVPVIIAVIWLSDPKDEGAATMDKAVQSQTKQSYAQLNSYYSDAKNREIFLPTIDQAYKLTKVERIKFDSTQSKMSYDEKMYFEQLFALTDKMVIERVYNYGAITNAKPLRPISYYDEVVAQMELLSVPSSAEKAHNLIAKAVKDQRDYFKYLIDSGAKWNANNPLVQNTHKGLLEAWQILLAAYPKESQHNLQAFEKHLCALDFI